MRHTRKDIVDGALSLLAQVGLPDLTMRRLGSELDVRASAIYHHFPNKQTLLGAVADEILARGMPAHVPSGSWDERLQTICTGVREAVLAYPDGADVVATTWAFGLGGGAPYDVLVAELRKTELDPSLADTAARTLLHFVYGHAIDEQTHAQAARVGAISSGRRADDFDAGLSLIVRGVKDQLAGIQLTRAETLVPETEVL